MSLRLLAPVSSSSLRRARLQPRPWGDFATYVVGNSVALILGLVIAYVALLYGGDITTSTIKTGDFMSYYSGSHLVATGHGGDMYSLAALRRVDVEIFRPLALPRGIVMGYGFPPYFAIALAPLAALPYALSYLVWAIINCILLVAIMFAIERYAGLTGRPALLFRLASICSLPTILCLINGQTSILILALVTASFFAVRSGREGLAGALLAVAAIKPAYIPILLIPFVVQRRWRVLLACAVTYVGLLILPMLLLGPSIEISYARVIWAAQHWSHGQFGWRDETNVSLTGFLQLLLPHATAVLLREALSALLLLSLVWAALRRSRHFDLTFGLAVVLAVLVSTHVMPHDLVLLFLPAAIALRVRKSGPPHLVPLLVAIYILTGIGYFLAFSLHLQAATLGMLGFTVWLLLLLKQLGGRNEAAAQPLENVL